MNGQIPKLSEYIKLRRRLTLIKMKEELDRDCTFD